MDQAGDNRLNDAVMDLLGVKAAILCDRQQYNEALPLLTEALDIARATGCRYADEVASNTADLCEAMGDLTKALEIDREVGCGTKLATSPPLEHTLIGWLAALIHHQFFPAAQYAPWSTVYRLAKRLADQGHPAEAELMLWSKRFGGGMCVSGFSLSALTIDSSMRYLDLLASLLEARGNSEDASMVRGIRLQRYQEQEQRRNEALEELRVQAMERRRLKAQGKKGKAKGRGSKSKKRGSSHRRRRHGQRQQPQQEKEGSGGSSIGGLEAKVTSLALGNTSSSTGVEGQDAGATAAEVEEQKEEEEECAVCTMPLLDEDDNDEEEGGSVAVKVLLCGHRFHWESCLVPWRGE